MKKIYEILNVATFLILAVMLMALHVHAESDSTSSKASIKKKCLKNKSYRNYYYSLCDPDNDRLTNRKESALKTNRFRSDTDKDGLKDGEEVTRYHTKPRKADTDGDGYKDGVEVRAGTNPRDPRSHPSGSNSCTIKPNPFDINGNTTSFSIPSGLTGNISRGQSFFAGHCSGCHGADKGTNYDYPQLVAAVTGPKMRLSFPQEDFADLVSYLNRFNIPPTPIPNCVLTPIPNPTDIPGGSGHPTPTPVPTHPGGSCTPQPNPFDGNGNTISFGIPSGIVGNISAGQSQYSQTCAGCHGGDRGTNYSYPSLFAAVNGPPMFLSSLTQQSIANLVAYLNRLNIPPTPSPNCNPSGTVTPTPTATPLSDTARGALVFSAACSSCHTNPRELRDKSVYEINEAIREVQEMRSIRLSAEQLRVLVVYLRSL